MKLEILTEKQIETKISTLEREILDLEDEIEEKEREVEALEKIRDEGRDFLTNSSEALKNLLPILEVQGTWHEREIVQQALNGEGLDKADRERVKSLCLQFLKVVL